MPRNTTFVTLNLDGDVAIYLPSEDDTAAADRNQEPDFVGNIDDAAQFLVDNGVEEINGSSSLDFATGYGWDFDDARTLITQAWYEAIAMNED